MVVTAVLVPSFFGGGSVRRPAGRVRSPEDIRNLHDSGNPANMPTPLATLAALLDRLGRYEPAATIAGFALSPLTSASVPEITPRSPTSATSSATRPMNRGARAGDDDRRYPGQAGRTRVT